MWLEYASLYFINLWICYMNRAQITQNFLGIVNHRVEVPLLETFYPLHLELLLDTSAPIEHSKMLSFIQEES